MAYTLAKKRRLDMNQYLLILTGPFLALCVLILFTIPSARPKTMVRRIGLIAGLLALPALAYATNSMNLAIAAFYFTPFLSVGGIIIALCYFIVVFDKHFPLVSNLPSVLIGIASGFNFYAVYLLGNSFGGGQC